MRARSHAPAVFALLVACQAPTSPTDAGATRDVGAPADAVAPDAVEPDAIVSVDVGTPAADADAEPVDAHVDTVAEDRACANLASIAPCGPASMDAALCRANFLDLRGRAGARCASDYAAWLDCLTMLSACPPGSGALCPTEYSALGICISPPPPPPRGGS